MIALRYQVLPRINAKHGILIYSGYYQIYFDEYLHEEILIWMNIYTPPPKKNIIHLHPHLPKPHGSSASAP